VLSSNYFASSDLALISSYFDILMTKGLSKNKILYLIRQKKKQISTKQISVDLKLSKRRIQQVWKYYLGTGQQLVLNKRGRKPTVVIEHKQIVIEYYQKYFTT